MKTLARWGACFAIGAGTLLAQVTVETVFEHEQYLANEPLRVGVRITNFSGETLKLGETPGWLDLLVESEQGKPVSQNAEPPTIEPFEVPSSSRATRWVDLIPYFDMGRVGRYSVTPTVSVSELGQAVTGKPASVNITSGAKIWEQDFGVHRAEDESSAPLEVRRYALLQAMNQKKIALYVRVTDQEEVRVFRVFPIGPILAFSRPEPQIDRAGRLHVLCQTSARQFTYSVVSPDGELVVRQLHKYADTRPALRAKEDGTVVVAGGYRQITSEDIPKPEKAPDPVLEPPAAATPPAAPEKTPDPSAQRAQGKKGSPKK